MLPLLHCPNWGERFVVPSESFLRSICKHVGRYGGDQVTRGATGLWVFSYGLSFRVLDTVRQFHSMLLLGGEGVAVEWCVVSCLADREVVLSLFIVGDSR